MAWQLDSFVVDDMDDAAVRRTCSAGRGRARNGGNLTTADEVLTRQCPCLGLSIHGAYVGAWRIRRLETETGGAHEFT
jgi:hypothetical protein